MENRSFGTGRLRTYQIPITLVFAPKPMAQSSMALYIQQASRLVTALADQVAVVQVQRNVVTSNQTTGDYPSYPFALTNVVFHPWEFRIAGNGTAFDVNMFVQHVVDKGIAIPEIAVTLMDPERKALGTLVNTITREGTPHRRRRHPVEALMVTSNSLRAFASVCSALVASTSLTRLQLYSAFDDSQDVINRSVKWKWLALALFSRVSRSTVRELFIDDQRLLLSDVKAIQSVIESAHPMQDCIATLDMDEDEQGEEAGDSEQHDDDAIVQQDPTTTRWVRLSPSAKLRLSQKGEESSFQQLGLCPAEAFPMISDGSDSEWMEIFTPGFGRVWVRCASIVEVHASSPQPSASQQQTTLTTLHLAFDACERGALAAMVRTIGFSLTSLDIDAKDNRLVQASDVAAIIQTCCQLKMLRLRRAQIGSLNVFLRAYEEKRCQISSLALWNVEVTNASLHKFAKSLADPNHPMAKTLQEFRYIFDDVGCVGDVARPDRKGIQLFLDMLLSNAVLSFMEIAMGDPLYDQFVGQFRDLDEIQLVSHANHLSMQSKIAFLSCVRVKEADGHTKTKKKSRRSSQATTATTGVLSKQAIGLIFHFARKRIHRVVSATQITNHDHVKAVIM